MQYNGYYVIDFNEKPNLDEIDYEFDDFLYISNMEISLTIDGILEIKVYGQEQPADWDDVIDTVEARFYFNAKHIDFFDPENVQLYMFLEKCIYCVSDIVDIPLAQRLKDQYIKDFYKRQYLTVCDDPQNYTFGGKLDFQIFTRGDDKIVYFYRGFDKDRPLVYNITKNIIDTSGYIIKGKLVSPDAIRQNLFEHLDHYMYEDAKFIVNLLKKEYKIDFD